MSRQVSRKGGKPAPWTPFARATPIMPSHHVIERGARQFGMSVEDYQAAHERRMNDETWKNSRYQVVIDRDPAGLDPSWPRLLHLSIKRIDRAPIHDWRDLQRIKNELVGLEHEAVELYPAESRVVDTANQYHLWVIAEPGLCFPFGWTERLVMSGTDGQSRQRPFEEDAADAGSSTSRAARPDPVRPVVGGTGARGPDRAPDHLRAAPEVTR